MAIEMASYMIVMKRKTGVASETNEASADNKPKINYDEAYLALGFKVNDGEIGRDPCVFYI